MSSLPLGPRLVHADTEQRGLFGLTTRKYLALQVLHAERSSPEPIISNYRTHYTNVTGKEYDNDSESCRLGSFSLVQHCHLTFAYKIATGFLRNPTRQRFHAAQQLVGMGDAPSWQTGPWGTLRHARAHHDPSSSNRIVRIVGKKIS